MKLAGQRHLSGIAFDNKGLPIFDDIAIFDTKISNNTSKLKMSDKHMCEATRNLRAEIQAGRIDPSKFTAQQLKDINAGDAKIPGLTWHHHQDIGRMQLVPEYIHGITEHIGGSTMWFGK